jgi:threonine/homoserine/homoserine lactone efflux protein
LRLAGAAFLCYLAWKLWQADGTATEGSIAAPPAFWEGVAAQWVNPKAWIVAIAGIAAYAVPGELYTASVIAMGAIFLVVCFPSVGAWAVIGAAARNLLRSPPAIRRFNRSMALLLLASVGTLFV